MIGSFVHRDCRGGFRDLLHNALHRVQAVRGEITRLLSFAYQSRSLFSFLRLTLRREYIFRPQIEDAWSIESIPNWNRYGRLHEMETFVRVVRPVPSQPLHVISILASGDFQGDRKD